MSEFSNRRGVNIVSDAALGIEWFFREQPTSDQGIDAHVEKAPNEVGTGRLIAVQIKAGPSYFREPVNDGWVFRFDAKKARLWLNHALPVIVALVDLDHRKAYWQVISSWTATPTGKDFKVYVPRDQEIMDADSEWTHLASGIQSRAVQQYEFALTQLPPSVSKKLRDHPSSSHEDIAVLALHLAEGKNNPEAIVESLIVNEPIWIQRQAETSWKAISSYAAEHDLGGLSADALERAAATVPGQRQKLLASAAINVLGSNRERARALVDEVESAGTGNLTTFVARALVEHPVGDAGPFRVDPALLADSEEVRGNTLVQSFLSEQATRSDDPDLACRHARMAHDAAPDDSSVMVLYADKLLRRSSTRKRQPRDLDDASSLLELALTQRRAWSGPTIPVLLTLVRSYALSGHFERMLSACLASPEGSASADEATNPEVRRNAVLGAWGAGRADLLGELAASLGDTSEDRIVRLRVGILNLTEQEAESLWSAELERASTESDYNAIVAASVELASLGRDESETLAPLVAASIIPSAYVDLVRALVTARVDLDAAIPELRSVARRHQTAAEFLISRLMAAGRFAEAADDCASLFLHSREPYLLFKRAQCLIEARNNAAEAAALEAVAVNSGFTAERIRLLTYLGAKAADRGDWHDAEKHLATVLSLHRPSSAEIWRVVLVQINQGRLPRAANTVAEYRPTVQSIEEAELWLKANVAVPWNESIASEALALARRFNDPRISTALLTQIITKTYGVAQADDSAEADQIDDEEGDDFEERRRLAQNPVPGELHRQAFAALDRLVNESGDATGVTVIRGDPEQQIARMAEMARQAADGREQFDDLLSAARDGLLPQGFVAALRGTSYATLLVQRTLGPLVAGAVADDEHGVEIEVAGESLGKQVVIDTTTLLVLSGLSSEASLEGSFIAMNLPASALSDIYSSALDIRGLAASPGTVGWNPATNSMALWELGDAEYLRQLNKIQEIENLCERVVARTVQELSLFDDLGDSSRIAVWAESIQLAHDQDLPLWSDDLGVRRVARHFGVNCFGTTALIDCLRDRELSPGIVGERIDSIIERTALFNRELALQMIVDVALHLEDLLWLAERDDWLPNASGLVLTRPSWWSWQVTPMRDLISLYDKVRENNVSALGDWQFAAMIGAAKAFMPVEVASKMLANISLIGYGAGWSIDVVVEGLKRARKVANTFDLPDPILQAPAAVSAMARAVGVANLEGLIQELLSHFDMPNG
ncbi:DUF4365 domain-containing protein [Actinoplanes auranticolor]|nr:DUF4365 domain-containing protein [Actinoplanes auranticolor]